MKINKDLLEKYNVAVPRYTSYPPANFFSSAYSATDYLAMLDESNSTHPNNVSLYLHIPFCKKICFYCGCNACSLGSGSQVKPYVAAIKKEIAMLSTHIDKKRKVSQIHYGGGTPNALPVEVLKELNALMFSLFTLSDNAEIAIECNPAYLDERYAKGLLEAGFNRFSLGIQDFDNDVLKTVNRDPSLLPVKEIMDHLRNDNPLVSINLDFIYGLPGQTVESFKRSINAAIALQPDRLVTFSYAHVPWMKKHQQILEKKGLPGPEQKMEMFQAGYRLLQDAGYKAIGFDHFVLEKDELYRSLKEHELHRNFQGYCTRHTTGQVYAIGVSGISQMENGYAQNVKEIDPYVESIEKGEFAIVKGLRLTKEQSVIREVINELMCNNYVHWSTISKRVGWDVSKLRRLLAVDNQVLDGFLNDGLLTYNEDEITVSELGSFFIRNIAAAIDPNYKEQMFNYSKSV